ncbi:hypothetical protein HGO38_29165 [Rhizobium sp. CG5]|nr:hypothetical protein [Rhizobium sp. CG5]MCM2477523.1 hypothetical protein [Rhizobium sp. CG5]
MALHPQTKAFLDAYNANAPTIDYDTISAEDFVPRPLKHRSRGHEADRP